MMRCAEIVGANLPLRLVTRPCLTAPPGGLLVRTTHAGVCHTDLHYIEDKIILGQGMIGHHSEDLSDYYVGLVLGHEVAGIIEEFGKDVNPQEYGLAVGDQVAVYPCFGCLKCGPCRIGYHNRCADNPGGVYTLGLGMYPGGYGTHVQVPSPVMVVKVPKEVPMHVACMLPCAGGTAFEALKKTREWLQYAQQARPNKPARLLIVGAGGLGLWALRLVSKAIPAIPLNITVADVDEMKLNTAMEEGADETVQWSISGDQGEDVKKTISNGLIDAAIDFVGEQRTSEIAMKSLERGGTLVLVGIRGGCLHVSIPTAIINEICIQGNLVMKPETLKELLELFANGEVTYEKVEFVKLDDINEVHERLKKGKVQGRAIIKYYNGDAKMN